MIRDTTVVKKPEKFPETEKPKPGKQEASTERFNMIEVKTETVVETPPPSHADLDLAKIDIDTKDGTIDEDAVQPGPSNLAAGSLAVTQ